MLQCLLAFLLAAAPVAAFPLQIDESDWPDSPPGRMARAYVIAFNAGEAEMMEFIRNPTGSSSESARKMRAEDEQKQLEFYRRKRKEYGDLEVLRIFRVEYQVVGLVCRGQAGNLTTVEIIAGPEPPQSLLTIRMQRIEGSDPYSFNP